MIRKILLTLLVVAFAVSMSFVGAGCKEVTPAEETVEEAAPAEETTAVEEAKAEEVEEAPSRVLFGHSGPITGVLASAETICKTFYELFTEQVNNKGGVSLSKYGTAVPLNWVVYNDQGDTGRAATNIEKLITQDKVDMIYGSYGTFQGFAQEPLVNSLAEDYGTMYMVGNGTCVKWETAEEFYDLYKTDEVFTDEQGRPWTEWEYTIWTEMPRAFHIEALVKVLDEVGVKSVVVWEIGTLYGAESSRFLEYLLPKVGIEILAKEQYPMDILDFTPLITKAQALNPDAIIQFSYPGDGMKSIEDMIAMNYNPKLFYNALGTTSGEAYTRFGANLDGILYHSFAFPKSPMSMGTFGSGIDMMNAYIDKYGLAPDMVDGSLAYATIEVMAELIRRAGSTDKEAIRAELLKTKDNPIPTVMGPMFWDKGPWPDIPGAVGQHIGTADSDLGQDCEIVGAAYGEMGGIERDWNVDDWTSSAAPVYPKPEWKK